MEPQDGFVRASVQATVLQTSTAGQKLLTRRLCVMIQVGTRVKITKYLGPVSALQGLVGLTGTVAETHPEAIPPATVAVKLDDPEQDPMQQYFGGSQGNPHMQEDEVEIIEGASSDAS